MNGLNFPKETKTISSSVLTEQVKKQSENKKRKNTKYIVAILLSNILVFLLTTPSKVPTHPDLQRSVFTKHKGFQILTLSLDPLVDLDNTLPERQVSLMNQKHQLVLHLGYLHEEVKQDIDTNLRRFKIEIPDGQIIKMGSLSTETLIAIPVQKNLTLTNKQESPYEINF